MRAFLVNSGILGHASVARLLARALANRSDLSLVTLNLSEGLTVRERVARRLTCWGGASPANVFDGLTLARWRRELHMGMLAARRISAAERRYGAPDVIHFHTQATALASLSRMRRTPSIVSIDITQGLASLEAPPGFRRWQYAACAARDARAFAAARAIVCTSQWAADDLARRQPECASRVHVMPLPVAVEDFGANWAEERATRPGALRVLFIGGDFERKGGPDLLDAWRAAALPAGAELHLVTDWPLPDRGLPAGVVVHRGVRAYTPEWFQQWRDADLFVLPSRGEAFGIVLQEAAAAGLPAIGTRINAIPELVVDGETGILVPPRAPDALAAAVARLAGDSTLRRRMGEAARRRALERYALSHYADRLGQLMRKVSTAAPRGDA
jgi:glycosyltransferase involved in cell wall biosynthesis